jgi:hypothetical protein
MNPTLRNLLMAIGVVTAAGVSMVVYGPASSGTTNADLQAAGIGACVQGEALCQVLTDAGYERIRVRGSACPEADGGWALIPDVEEIDAASLVMTHEGSACVRATGANKLKANEKRLKEPNECGCAPFPAVGTCKYLGATAPHRVHFLPGEWSGGCVQKACGEFGGRSSWPADLCGPESVTP